MLLLTAIVTRPGGLPDTYVPLSSTIALSLLGLLLLVYLGGAVARTLVRGLQITGFEAIQTIGAFLIAVTGALRIASGNSRATFLVGLFSLLAAAACYLVSYALVERRQMPRLNLYTYTTFAFLLVLLGSRLLLDGFAEALLWSALAVVCLWTGLLSERRTLLAQATAYLAASCLVSGAAVRAGLYLLGQAALLPPPPVSSIAATASAMWGAGVLLIARSGDDILLRRVAWVAFFGVAGWNTAGMLAWLLASTTGGIAARGPLSATLATVLLCSLLLLLLWIGRSCGRPELVWLVPPLLAITAYKVLVEDLRNGEAWTIVVSLLALGAVLVVLPRLLQKRQAP
jgi:hypothetical protein